MGEEAAAEETPTQKAATDDAGAEGTDESSDEGYAFGVEREDLASAIETAFSTRDGKATWEGDELVVSFDEDSPDLAPGFTECRIVTGFTLEGDTARIDFKDDSVDCEEVLEET